MGQHIMFHPADCVLPSGIFQFPELRVCCSLALVKRGVRLWRYTYGAPECGSLTSLWLAHLWICFLFVFSALLVSFLVWKQFGLWFMTCNPGLSLPSVASIVFVPGRSFFFLKWGEKNEIMDTREDRHLQPETFLLHLMPNTFSCFRCTFLQCQRWNDSSFPLSWKPSSWRASLCSWARAHWDVSTTLWLSWMCRTY